MGSLNLVQGGEQMSKASSKLTALLAACALVELALGRALAADLPAEANPPKLADLPDNLQKIFKAVYECRDKKGKGCSAGCASASFSPLTRLSVVLVSVPINGQNTPMYYYLAEFPEDKDATDAENGTKNRVTKAEGFILSSNAVCGTVNMDLTISKP
jgi:hypothetical protein